LLITERNETRENGNYEGGIVMKASWILVYCKK
jgi:hypothetical protein